MKFKFILCYYFCCIIFLSGVIWGRLVYAEATTAKTPVQIIEQEIQQYDNPQVLRQLWEQVVNESNVPKRWEQIISESNAAKRLELISAMLKLVDKEKQPYLCGILHVFAGNTLGTSSGFNRAENLEQAIEHHQQALTIFTRKAFPEDWAMTQYNLAVTYNDRIRGDRANNLEQAIEHCQQALTVYTHKAFPEGWAMTQNNLAVTYRNRIRGERADNLEQAIEHFQQALTVVTRQAFPEKWAMTQNNLANAYNYRIHGERADNLEQAIKHYQQALTVFYTRKAFPEYWAITQNNLALVYWKRIRGERTDNLEQAIKHAQQALTVYTRQAFPEMWANTQNNLANAYRERIRGERADNLEQAIEYYQQALTVYTREAFPEMWATTQNNLALAYWERIRGERADNLEQAIEHFQQALTVSTRKAFPEKWAGVQDNLAAVYSDRFRGEQANNLEQAIKHSQQALTVFTRKAFPEDWAKAQNNLAIIYSNRANNLERALEYYQQALEVFTHEAFPEDFIRSTAGLSKVLLTTQQYSTALTHLKAALQTNETLLQQISFTPAERHRLVKNAETSFANAVFAAVQSGDYIEAVRFLEWGKTRLLRQKLALDTVHLQKLPAKQQSQLQQLQSIVTNLEIQLQNPQQTDSAILAQLRQELKQQRQQLRQQLQQSGITATQAPQSNAINQWLQTLPVGSVLIAPVFTDFGTVVFLMPAGIEQIEAQQVLKLPDFSRQDLQAITRGKEEDRWGGYLEAYWQWQAEADQALREQKRQPWQQQLTAALEQLRTDLLEPIFTRLSALKIQPGAHLFWLPDSDSNLLPIHAISIAKQPILSRYTVHFIPSLYSWYTAQQHLLSQTSADHTNQLLALINPTENLAYAPIEGEIVSHFFAAAARTILPGTTGTHAQLKQALANHPLYLHFSTHGRYDWSNPLESGLALANKEHWTLSDLLTETDLSGSRLAVLSACETGLTDIGMPTEALGLPAGFLQAGIPGVISTLWTVEEVSTTFLLGKFYELHLNQGMEPAKALGQAQVWLRAATYQNLRDWLSSWLSRLLPNLPNDLKNKMITLLEDFRKQTRQNPTEKPYSELYYWAGFIYTGV